MRATRQDGTYPRPLMCREQWTDLDGTWEFAVDDADRGLRERWFARAEGLPERIEVPFPPESPASGIGRRGFHPVVWYRRPFSLTELAPDGLDERRLLVHLGAVDHAARVWCDGQLVATHVGGQSPFTADLTDALASGADEHTLVVRAEDDPTDPHQARGKQDWRERPHGIWYERTTGIWQSVWAECVPDLHVEDVAWVPDPAHGIGGEITLSRTPAAPTTVSVTVSLDDEVLAEVTCLALGRVVDVDVPIEALRNAQDRGRLLWSPDHPTLLDVSVSLLDRLSAQVVDTVTSYVGLRTVGVGRGAFLLDDQPLFVRAVLNQGYRRETHLAARDTDEMRTEVETIRALGFNSVRLHQKCEDPRWLHWADRLGLLVWGEAGSAYAFSSVAVGGFVPEWTAIVRRYRSHPSLAVWVPINESWGVPELATSTAQRSYSRALAELTRALDPTRPVVSNEGWEHLDSDILGLHDYSSAAAMRARHLTREALSEVVLGGRTPHGHRVLLGAAQEEGFVSGETPVMVTEFGGISLVREDADEESWGYSTVSSADDLAGALRAQFGALRASPGIAGLCYTQYMDTGLETNGLLYADRSPKLPLETLRQIVTGQT